MPTGACAAEKSKNGTPATNEQQDKTAKMKNNRGERDNVHLHWIIGAAIVWILVARTQ
jgi:hypothetical protein